MRVLADTRSPDDFEGDDGQWLQRTISRIEGGKTLGVGEGVVGNDKSRFPRPCHDSAVEVVSSHQAFVGELLHP